MEQNKTIEKSNWQKKLNLFFVTGFAAAQLAMNLSPASAEKTSHNLQNKSTNTEIQATDNANKRDFTIAKKETSAKKSESNQINLSSEAQSIVEILEQSPESKKVLEAILKSADAKKTLEFIANNPDTKLLVTSQRSKNPQIAFVEGFDSGNLDVKFWKTNPLLDSVHNAKTGNPSKFAHPGLLRFDGSGFLRVLQNYYPELKSVQIDTLINAPNSDKEWQNVGGDLKKTILALKNLEKKITQNQIQNKPPLQGMQNIGVPFYYPKVDSEGVDNTTINNGIVPVDLKTVVGPDTGVSVIEYHIAKALGKGNGCKRMQPVGHGELVIETVRSQIVKLEESWEYYTKTYNESKVGRFKPNNRANIIELALPIGVGF
jgi:hypothetical protein